MFAIALWDDREQRLILVRDRLGVKPLFYSTDQDRLLFASEIKSIFAIDSSDFQIDDQALYDYLCVGYVPAPRTIFSSIKKLPTGSVLVADESGVRISKYWDAAPKTTFEGDVTEATDELKRTVR